MQKLCFRPSPLTRNARRRQKHQRLRWMFEVCRDIASTSRLHFCRQAPTDKHTRPARQNEAYDNCVFVVLGFTPFVPMGPKTRPRRKLLVAFRRHAVLHQKTTPKSGPLTFEFSAPEPYDFVPVWGTLGAQCSAKFPGQVVTSTLAANSTCYLQMGQARDCFSIILAASWI